MKKKVLKTLLIIVLIIILLILVKIGRNFFIISTLQKKYEEITLTDNYHIKQIGYQYSDYIISDMYKKDNKEKVIVNILSLEDYSKQEFITISDNDSTTTYFNRELIDNSNNTTNNQITIKKPYSLYSKESASNILIELFNTKLKTTTYHGEECYLLNNSMTKDMYISKKTGLVLRENKGYVATDNGKKIEMEYIYYYEFNKVLDKDVVF